MKKREAVGRTGWADGRMQDGIVLAVLGVLTVILFAGFLFSDRMLFGTDTVPTGYMARKVLSEYLVNEGVLPLWNPYIVGGLPFIDALHGDVLYPATLLNLVMPAHRFIGMKLVLHVFLAGVCMYAFLRARKIGRTAAAVGGLGYMFAPYLVSLIYAGHDGKLYVTSLLPLAFCCLEKGLRSLRAFYFAMMGGSIGLLLLTSHVQMASYVLWALGLYLVFDLAGRRERQRGPGAYGRPVGLFVFGVALGLALGLVQLLPSYIYTRAFSPRAGGVSYEFATSWSLHPEEIVSLAIPQFVHYLGDYWGRNPFKLNCEAPGLVLIVLGNLALCLLWTRRVAAVYFGSLVAFFLSLVTGGALQGVLIALALSGFAVSIWRARGLAFYLLVAVFALFYSVGAHTPVYKLFFYGIPGVKFFRAPSTIMMLFLFSMASMAGVGAGRLEAMAGSKEVRRVAGKILWVVAGGGVVLIALAVGRHGIVGFWERVVLPEMGARRAAVEMNYPHFLRGYAVALALVAGVALCAWLLGDRRVRPGWAVGGLGVLVVLGSWPVDRDFILNIRVGDFVRRDGITERMAGDRSLFRVLPLTGSQIYDRNYLPIFGFQTLNGFHDNRLRIFDEITGEGRLTHPRILDLYNTKYVITGAPISAPGFEELEVRDKMRLYRNRNALPRAFVVYDFEVIEDEGRALERLMEPDFDYRRRVILDTRPRGLAPDSTRAPTPATVEAYGPNRIRIRTETDAPGLLFIGDNYFPYWRAEVDGAPAEVWRCDYAFRAVPVPAGTREVVLRYRSDPLIAGGVVSGASAALILGWLVAHAVRRFRRTGGGGQ